MGPGALGLLLVSVWRVELPAHAGARAVPACSHACMHACTQELHGMRMSVFDCWRVVSRAWQLHACMGLPAHAAANPCARMQLPAHAASCMRPPTQHAFACSSRRTRARMRPHAAARMRSPPPPASQVHPHAHSPPPAAALSPTAAAGPASTTPTFLQPATAHGRTLRWPKSTPRHPIAPAARCAR